MELVVRGRNVEVPDHFRTHVAEKFTRIERYDAHIIRTDVELTHERNRRQSGNCQRVEITCRVKGPVVRAEACAENFYAALEAAVDKIEARFRRSADRRRVHHGRRAPRSVADATAPDAAVAGALVDPTRTATAVLDNPEAGPDGLLPDGPLIDGPLLDGPLLDGQSEDGPGRIVREKVHEAKPMSVQDALLEMELVGHDFFLFHDAAADRPSVVYRRHAYDYGLIRLGS